MRITLREVEPFNIPPVENHEAALFMRHLTGGEAFDFDGDKKPKSMLLYEVIYKYPRLCSAHGWLLSVDIDTYENLCNAGVIAGRSTEYILKQVIIGSIGIDFGGDLSSPSLYASELNMNK